MPALQLSRAYVPEVSLDDMPADLRSCRASSLLGGYNDSLVDGEFRRFQHRDLGGLLVAIGTGFGAVVLTASGMYRGDNDAAAALAIVGGIVGLLLVAADLFFALSKTWTVGRANARYAISLAYMGMYALSTGFPIPGASSNCVGSGDVRKWMMPGTVPDDIRPELRLRYCVRSVQFVPLIAIALAIPALKYSVVMSLTCGALIVGGFFAGYFLLTDIADETDISRDVTTIALIYACALGIATAVSWARGVANRTAFEAAIEGRREQKAATRRAKQADLLLTATLPRHTLNQLVTGVTGELDEADSAAVYFADMKGFTAWSSRRDAISVFRLLSSLTEALDGAAAARHVVEKVKTIGDAYWAVCGLPEPVDDPADIMLDFALEAQMLIVRLRESNPVEWGDAIAFRTGLAVERCMGGILGTQRLSYEVVGPATDLAMFCEKHGEADRICATQLFFDSLSEISHLHPVPHPTVVAPGDKAPLLFLDLQPFSGGFNGTQDNSSVSQGGGQGGLLPPPMLGAPEHHPSGVPPGSDPSASATSSRNAPGVASSTPGESPSTSPAMNGTAPNAAAAPAGGPLAMFSAFASDDETTTTNGQQTNAAANNRSTQQNNTASGGSVSDVGGGEPVAPTTDRAPHPQRGAHQHQQQHPHQHRFPSPVKPGMAFTQQETRYTMRARRNSVLGAGGYQGTDGSDGPNTDSDGTPVLRGQQPQNNTDGKHSPAGTIVGRRGATNSDDDDDDDEAAAVAAAVAFQRRRMFLQRAVVNKRRPSVSSATATGSVASTRRRSSAGGMRPKSAAATDTHSKYQTEIESSAHVMVSTSGGGGAVGSAELGGGQLTMLMQPFLKRRFSWFVFRLDDDDAEAEYQDFAAIASKDIYIATRISISVFALAVLLAFALDQASSLSALPGILFGVAAITPIAMMAVQTQAEELRIPRSFEAVLAILVGACLVGALWAAHVGDDERAPLQTVMVANEAGFAVVTLAYVTGVGSPALPSIAIVPLQMLGMGIPAFVFAWASPLFVPMSSSVLIVAVMFAIIFATQEMSWRSVFADRKRWLLSRILREEYAAEQNVLLQAIVPAHVILPLQRWIESGYAADRIVAAAHPRVAIAFIQVVRLDGLRSRPSRHQSSAVLPVTVTAPPAQTDASDPNAVPRSTSGGDDNGDSDSDGSDGPFFGNGRVSFEVADGAAKTATATNSRGATMTSFAFAPARRNDDDDGGGDDEFNEADAAAEAAAALFRTHVRIDRVLQRAVDAGYFDKIKTVGDTVLIGGPFEPRDDLSDEEGAFGDDGDHAGVDVYTATGAMVRSVAVLTAELNRRVPGGGDDTDEGATVDSSSLSHCGVSIAAGMHVGPVAAGVLGTSRLCFDVVGDAVNVAARAMSAAAAANAEAMQSASASTATTTTAAVATTRIAVTGHFFAALAEIHDDRYAGHMRVPVVTRTGGSHTEHSADELPDVQVPLASVDVAAKGKGSLRIHMAAI